MLFRVIFLIRIILYIIVFGFVVRQTSTKEVLRSVSRTNRGYDHINRNAPVLVRSRNLTRFEPAQYWGGPPGNGVELCPFFCLEQEETETEKQYAGFEAATFRLVSECSTTKLIWRPVKPTKELLYSQYIFTHVTSNPLSLCLSIFLSLSLRSIWSYPKLVRQTDLRT
jgi:hypothetical protein